MEHPKGIIGVATGEIGRYRLFDIALARVKKPEGSDILWAMGVDVPGNNNFIIQTALSKDYQWAWLLGDDHEFDDNLLMRLLDRDVDIVVPLCTMRHKPFLPVLRGVPSNGSKAIEWDYLKNKSGMIELSEYNVGNGGMLIRRNVMETMHYPWFENGKMGVGTGCDLWFCEKAKQYRFKVYVDLDNTIGHIVTSVVWPRQANDGTWTHEILTE